ncbi:TBC1 domain family member 10B-like [Lingula anatina]|uniref:TBC1 domain family member 10B-like n=1 Tax=Lingula anatina TaxID=7574 RepID=A0A1S3KEH3_LINAN|nr:TBC1 domain family member 10B-like [Lingula anatina]|eukprot:XP_013421030.1 TBC1 domain family member 10B-like [Lingula anatina]
MHSGDQSISYSQLREKWLESVEGFDSYGFAVFAQNSGNKSSRCNTYQKHPLERCVDEDGKWEELMKNWDHLKADRKFAKLRSMLSKGGVPDPHRSWLWQTLLEMDSLKTTSKFCYKSSVAAIREQLVDLGISEYGNKKVLHALGELEDEDNDQIVAGGGIDIHIVRQIFLDLSRTYPTHKMFMENTPLAKETKGSLFRVLASYVRYNPAVGYCQGMSFISGLLLMHMQEQDAFWCTVALFERQKYLMGFFDSHLKKVQSHASVFKKLLKDRLPSLSQLLDSKDLDPLLYITPWFMGLFTSLPSWDTVLGIWDRLMLEGVGAIFAAALTIMKLCEADLVEAEEFCHMVQLLLHLPPEKSRYEVFMPVFWDTRVEKWELDSLLEVVHEEAHKPSSARKRRVLSSRENTPDQNRKRHRQDEPISVFQRFKNIFTPAQSASGNRTATRGTLSSRPQHKPQLVPGDRRKSGYSKGRSGQQGGRLLTPGTPRRSMSSNQSFRNAQRSSAKASPGVRKVLQKKGTPVTSIGNRLHQLSVQFSADQEAIEIRSPMGRVMSEQYVRRSPRIAKQKALVGVNTPSSMTPRYVRCSAKVQHAFKAFNTPVPLRKSQERKVTPQLNSAPVTSPEVELQPINGDKLLLTAE